MTRLEQGKYFEQQAQVYLVQQGLILIDQNFHSRFGEIDLIMLDKNTLVFIEVRYRHQAAYGSALATVNSAKQQKIHKTAQYFLLKHPVYHQYACRFDIIAIEPNKLQWVKGAFY